MTDPSTLQAAYNFASAGMPVLWIDVRKRYLAEDLKVWMGKGAEAAECRVWGFGV